MTMRQLFRKACHETGKKPNELQSVYKDADNHYVFCFSRESSGENDGSVVTNSCDDDTGLVYIALTPSGEVGTTAPYLWTGEVAIALNELTGESAP